MLARDAENLYWMGRYLGRAENMARMVLNITDKLLDSPYEVQLGWPSLLKIAGVDNMYKQWHRDINEDEIIAFLLNDEHNQSSIVSCIHIARENVRTLREMLPEELWERINSMHLYAREQSAHAISSRRARYVFLENIISYRHAIVGAIMSSMPRDMAYFFLKLGTNIERADMTSRIMDIHYAMSLNQDNPLHEATLQSLWMGILKSLSATQAYHQLKGGNPQMAEIINFLYHDKSFPRSIAHCLHEIEDALQALPQPQAILRLVASIKTKLDNGNIKTLNVERLHEWIDVTQQYLDEIHHAIAQHYFIS